MRATRSCAKSVCSAFRVLSAWFVLRPSAGLYCWRSTSTSSSMATPTSSASAPCRQPRSGSPYRNQCRNHCCRQQSFLSNDYRRLVAIASTATHRIVHQRFLKIATLNAGPRALGCCTQNAARTHHVLRARACVCARGIGERVRLGEDSHARLAGVYCHPTVYVPSAPVFVRQVLQATNRRRSAADDLGMLSVASCHRTCCIGSHSSWMIALLPLLCCCHCC